MEIKVNTAGLDILAAKFRGLSERKIDTAIVAALNQAAYVSWQATRSEVQAVFKNPTPWVVRGARYTKAIRGDQVNNLGGRPVGGAKVLTATVDFDYWGNKQGVTVADVLHAEIYGGQRRLKRHEVALRNAGVLPSGYYIVPGKQAKIDQYGNMSAGEINKIISWFAASEGVGYNRMTKDKRKAALKRGTKKNNFLGFEYLLVSPNDPKTKHLKPGIYARFITGFGSTLDPVMIFVKKAVYQKRLDFYGVATREAEKELDRVLPMYLDQFLKERGL